MSTSSHSQIVKSSSVIGSAQLINYIIGLVRMKVVAVLLGPSGVGLVGLYVSTISLVGTVTKLGLGESGVREIASASSNKEPGRVGLEEASAVLHKLCWCTGVVGWIVSAVLAWPLSIWIFESKAYAMPLAILGCVVLIESLASSNQALLQGLRKILDLAKTQIISGLIATAFALLIYWRLGQEGIVPVIVVTGLVTLGVSGFYVRRLKLPKVRVSLESFVQIARSLLRLGALFAFVTVLSAFVGLGIRAIITRELGLESAGYYQAATVLTALLGGLMIRAMATDLYPRLTANIQDSPTAGKLVNEQIQTGMVIAAPLLCGLLAFRELAIELVYSASFRPAVTLVPWLLAGVFLQVVIVPMEFVARAKAHVGWLSTTQSVTHLMHLAIVAVCTAKWGLISVGYASFVSLAVQAALSHAAARSIVGFRLDAASVRKTAIAAAFFLSPLIADMIHREAAAVGVKLICFLACVLWATRELADMLGVWPWTKFRLWISKR